MAPDHPRRSPLPACLSRDRAYRRCTPRCDGCGGPHHQRAHDGDDDGDDDGCDCSHTSARRRSEPVSSVLSHCGHYREQGETVRQFQTGVEQVVEGQVVFNHQEGESLVARTWEEGGRGKENRNQSNNIGVRGTYSEIFFVSRLTSKTLGVFSSQEPPALELPPPGPSRVGCLVLSQELELDGM